jgi:hypothetical protein
MTPNATALAQQFAALTEKSASLASKLGQAARELQVSGILPPESLAAELAALHREFVDLRTGVLEVARALSIAVPTDVDSVKNLEPVVQGVVAAFATGEKREAAAEYVKRALGVLDRVLAVVHTDDPAFGALAQCQAKAKEMRQAVGEAKALDTDKPAALVEATAPFAALLTLIEGREQLDDERFAALEDSVNQSFGRSLAVAATRGKLVIAAAAGATPAPPATRPAPPPRTLEEAVRSAPAAPAPAPPPAPAVQEVVAVAKPADAEEQPGAAQAVEQAVQDEGAQWWVSAWARWTSWKSTLSFNDAVKQELQKYSYLLSVPIQKSTDYEEGLLSYGYSLLLEFVERQNPGFVNKALNSLKTITPSQAKSVGAHLYSFLVDEGRLGQLYPEFVKGVLVAAVPEPGLWTQARILESTVETRVFTHPSARVGDGEHTSQRLTQDRQRFTDHRFQVVVAPLTARFFAVAGDLREPRTIDVKLSEGRNDSEQAWLLTMPPAGRADLKSELVRVAPEGTSVPGLGREYATLWIAVFNTDPVAEKRYELVLGLRKEAGAKPAATFGTARA